MIFSWQEVCADVRRTAVRVRPALLSIYRSVLAASLLCGVMQAQHTTWREYGGSPDGAQYSALRQINRTNVPKLQKVWVFETGDERGYAFNPVVIGKIMYVLAHDNAVVALDAATGRELWSHPLEARTSLIMNRGFNYWESADKKDRRLILAVDNGLEELDAATGKPITSFGNSGRVDLREGLGRDPKRLTLVQSYNP